jgi:hypothetical protein
MIHPSFRSGLILMALLLLALPAGQAQAQEDNQGFIYGRIVTNSGSEYQGFIRWGTQEAFWDDLFHSVKEDLPYHEYLEDRDYDRLRRGRSRIRIFDWDFSIEGSSDLSHQFIARFGDMASMEIHRGDWVEILMKNGSEYEVSGGSNDVSDDIHISDPTLGEIDLRWSRIESIEFMQAPRGADPGVTRLFGTVETRDGEFQGYIQWDQDECLSTDVLDGDTEDGDVSIRMGSIQSIERISSRRSRVTLKDGRELRLEGSNDVNDENRGIMVEDPRFGRATVSWDAFDRITFSDPPNSGRRYNDLPALGELSGTVTDVDGEQYTGRIVFDLDEAEGWEMMNGEMDGIEYNIPMSMVRSVEPMRRGSSRIVLDSGETLTLEESHDVGEDNSGVLIFDGGRDPTYIRWEDVERIEFGN